MVTNNSSNNKTESKSERIQDLIGYDYHIPKIKITEREWNEETGD